MRRPRRFAALAMCAALICTLVGCDADPNGAQSGRAAQPRSDAVCTVHLRRDFLGVASTVPIPVSTPNHNGSDITITGKLVRMGDAWMVIETADGTQEWIPRTAILHMTVKRS